MKVNPLLNSVTPKTFLQDLLSAYGIENQEEYLHPNLSMMDSPFDYPNMNKAVEIAYHCITNKNTKIGILSDEDADGQFSSAILYDFLKSQGQNPTVIQHTDKQHGLSNDVWEQIQESKFDILFIPDAGTNNVEQCKQLYKSSTQVIILDHHNVDVDNPYAIVVNHHLSNSLNHALSGTGVTYKFIQSYCQKFNIDCPDYMDMVACSLVSDVCDLSSIENRAFLEYGIHNSIQNPMLKQMFDELAKGNTTPKDVAFSVVPKINALTRSNNQEAKEIFFNALVSDNEDDIKQGIEVALEAYDEQSKIVDKISRELLPNIDNSHNVIIAFIGVQYKNYSGLIANKILGQYHKPTLVLRELNENQYSGSVRSPIEIASLVNETGYAKCEGHESACGIYFDKSNLDNLIQWFDNQDMSAEPETPVTAILEPNEITTRLCNICESYKHVWGHGVEEPKFYIKATITPNNVNLYKKKFTTIKITIGKVNFLKFKVNKELVSNFENFKKLDIEMVVTLETNEWNGRVTPQAMIQDIEVKEHLKDGNKTKKLGKNNRKKESWEDLF